MPSYYVRGLTGGIATAGADEPIGQLWNPSSTRRITVMEVSVFLEDFNSLAGNSLYIARTTTRGTAASTVTPDSDNAERSDSSPPSGALLDLAEFSASPTQATPILAGPGVLSGVTTGAEGCGFLWPAPWGVIIPPGTGICVYERLAETYSGGWEVSYVFED